MKYLRNLKTMLFYDLFLIELTQGGLFCEHGNVLLCFVNARYVLVGLKESFCTMNLATDL
jgi:hypothetical protein